ncbi:peroxidase [Novosphingobium sp. AAP83]|uniref:catalase/peroxidase HPI n=1 Tax=Novosphingobium sp. AAP83 TaxID=1523425 RepID=UPI0006B927DD|nr:catalase/peroxidase HPI [Novosphingobium sp. AAP83]KPF90618.1 peroxidase [Novosphingobium sp. AAP83]
MTIRRIALIALMAAASPLAVAGSAHADTATESPAAKEWWPKSVDLTALRQNEAKANPYGPDFDYAKEFASLDLEAVKADIRKVLKTSQAWWPADYGHYGPFFVRMAWHSAGTYRTGDGRGGSDGGELRFEPLNSWPDNVNLDKARRLVWPIKQKYGRKLSWGDLMVLSSNVAMEDMGFKTLGFAGGRIDAWQPDLVFWGPETKLLEDKRRDAKGNLKGPLAATQMGLIYVNPEGPNGVPDPLAAANDIRRAFSAMAMSDEESAALIAGGHTFGKAHGAHKPEECVAADPGTAKIEQQGLGWANKCGKGNAEDTVTSGLEGAWSANPIAFTTQYLDNLYGFEWVKTKSPAGATQWIPKDPAAATLVPDAHRPDVRHAPIMFTTDIAMREDPGFRKITQGWQKNPQAFADAFARAWFKLTHRDMGPQARYIGKDVPTVTMTWQDPLPKADYAAIGNDDVVQLKSSILSSGLTTAELVRTAWASASSFRSTDMRGGANGARLRLAPQKDWAVNDPAEVAKVTAKLEAIRTAFNKGATGGKKVSLADLIVLGGNAAIEQAAKAAGQDVSVPFAPGRVDATQAQTDVTSFNYLQPKADGFRNYFAGDDYKGPVEALVDKADMLGLTVPETTVLLGGMRVLGANAGGSSAGVFTSRPGTLTNDFFTNLLSMDTVWAKSAANPAVYEGKDRTSGAAKWTATPVDLVFGSNSELRAVAEVYASDDAKAKFTADFVAAWTKVMNADRF